jgi:hypothetical protein
MQTIINTLCHGYNGTKESKSKNLNLNLIKK